MEAGDPFGKPAEGGVYWTYLELGAVAAGTFPGGGDAGTDAEVVCEGGSGNGAGLVIVPEVVKFNDAVIEPSGGTGVLGFA